MYAKLLKKNRILDAGLDLFYNQGYNGTGVKDIVDAAGVPKGSFYNYFDSKEAFAVEALDKLASEHLEEMRTNLLHGDAPAGQRIIDSLNAKIEKDMDENFYAGCLMGNLCQEMAGCCEAIRLKVSELMDSHINIVAEAIEQGQKDGSINTSLNARETAEFMFAAWEGALMKMKADRSRRAFDVFLSFAARLFKP